MRIFLILFTLAFFSAGASGLGDERHYLDSKHFAIHFAAERWNFHADR